MKAIIYFGHLGSTRKAGEYLKNLLKDTDIFDGNSIKKVDFSPYDTLILGINVRMGKLNKKFIKFIKKLQKRNSSIETHAYIVAADKNLKSTYIHMARGYLSTNSYVIYAGGELDSSNAKGLSKAVIEHCIAQFKAEDLELPTLDFNSLDAFAIELEEKKIPIC
ncbi:MAG: hypothetical protein K2I42_02320 [Anaeroplasmataceae bacterium]|nr:hypothetical protein [Anaeroplasmataceae bacterium]